MVLQTQTVEEAPTRAPGKKTNWTPIVAVAGGSTLLGLGLWIYFRGKPFGPGDKIDCLFKFKHAGPGGDFVFRLVMGHTIEVPGFPIFDEMPETMQEFTLPIPPSDDFEMKEIEVTYEVPEVLAKDKYDLEASIRWPDSSIVDGMRVIANDIIVVE